LDESSTVSALCACRGVRGTGAGWEQLYGMGIQGEITAEYMYDLTVLLQVATYPQGVLRSGAALCRPRIRR